MGPRHGVSTSSSCFWQLCALAHPLLSLSHSKGCPTKTAHATKNLESRSRASRTPNRGAQSQQQHHASPAEDSTSSVMKVGKGPRHRLNIHLTVLHGCGRLPPRCISRLKITSGSKRGSVAVWVWVWRGAVPAPAARSLCCGEKKSLIVLGSQKRSWHPDLGALGPVKLRQREHSIRPHPSTLPKPGTSLIYSDLHHYCHKSCSLPRTTRLVHSIHPATPSVRTGPRLASYSSSS